MAPRRTTLAATHSALDTLGEEQIVEAALQLIRKSGVDRLSMRALAAQLGVTPMAIYYYVPHKEALLDRVVDAVYGQIPTPTPDPERWQEQIKDHALAAQRLVEAHPGLSRVIVERPNALARYGIALLLAGGFDPPEAALALATYQTYLFGIYSAYASGKGRPERRKGEREARGRRAARDGDLGDAVARHLRELSTEDLLNYGIDVFLDGIAAHAKRSRGPRRADSPS